MANNKPIVLIILDGWGYRENPQHNAIYEAKTPTFDHLWKKYPHCLLQASGSAVGLPDGQMGNSEVGHIALGAGTALDTDLVRISKSAGHDEFKNNPAFVDLFNHVKDHHSILHVMGLLSPGGVHSHSQHLYEFLRAAKKSGIAKVVIHAFTDGRDTPPQSAHEYLKELEDVLEEVKIAHIATVSGRYYAMDRDKNWDRLAKVEKVLFESKGNLATRKPSETVLDFYNMNITDEFLEPLVFLDDSGRSYPIAKNDGVFFFNFRADRARQLSHKIAARAEALNLCFVTMSEYDPSIPAKVAFPPQKIATTLAAEISKAGLEQVHIAETEKFAHATFYFNGGRQEPHQYEEQILIDSRKDVVTHDEAPEMRAVAITDKVVECLNHRTPFIFVNFANPDMIGHTGNKLAIINALEVVDRELARIAACVQANDAVLFITADHGNAEINLDENGNPHTAHTTNDVPAILIAPSSSRKFSLQDGTITDVAPTILDILRLPKPASMTGHSLLD